MSKPKQVKESNWRNYGIRIFVNTVAHPLEYAKVLIQLGHDPIPPRPATSIFGKPTLKLPNIFEYVRYIKSVDGFVGCYRGLVPKVCGNLICAIASENMLDKILRDPNDEDLELEDDDNDLSEESRRLRKRESERIKFFKTLKKDVIGRMCTIVISHPFHVITIRMMAQFIGRETRYSGIFASIGEIYRQNGIIGFFSGLIPRLIGDVLFLIIASALTYGVNNYVFEETELQAYTSATMSFAASAITYPFQLVANCMAVSRSGLVAGQPPHMPLYNSWMDCWSDLSHQGQLKRGSSLLFRYYVGPQVIINGRALPVPRQVSPDDGQGW